MLAALLAAGWTGLRAFVALVVFFLFALGTVLLTTAEPETKTSGNWPFSTFDTGPVYRFTITPTNASTNAQFTGGAFYALLAANDNGGIWLTAKQIQLFNASTGALIAASGTMAWTAGMVITVTIRIASGTNNSSITIAGATSGNGTTTFTIGSNHIFTDVTLGVGIYGGGGFTWVGAIGDVDTAGDDIAPAPASGAGTAVTPALTVANVNLTPAPAAATGTGVTPTLDPGGQMFPAPAAGAATGVNPTLTAGAVSTSAPSPAAATSTGVTPTLTNTTLSLGVHGKDFQIYGHASRDASVTLTFTAGSMVLVFAGGRSTDVGGGVTSSRGETFRRLDQVRDYTDYLGYGTVAYAAYNVVGGSTTLTLPVTLFDENTTFVVEVKRGKIVRSLSWLQVANASGGPTLTSGNAITTAAAQGIALWWGAGPVFTPSSTPFTAVPDKGTVVESYLVNNSDGEVQGACDVFDIAAPVPPATTVSTNVVWTHSPNQGGQALILAIQDDEILPIAAGSAAGVAPTLAPGALSITASPASAAAAAVTPTISVTLPATPAAAAATGVAPSLVPGAVSTAAASPASASGVGVDPALAPAGVPISPAPAAGAASGVAPTLTPGNAPLVAVPAAGAAVGAAPVLAPGGTSLAPVPAASAGSAVDPALSSGASLTPAPAAASAVGVSPSAAVSTEAGAPASASGSATTPTLVTGIGMTASPAPASASAVDPALTTGAASMAPAPAAASGVGVDPTVSTTGNALTPAPAAAGAVGVAPTLVPGGVQIAAAPTTATAAARTPVLSDAGIVDLPARVTFTRTTRTTGLSRTTRSTGLRRTT